jgi:RNA polymerase sigma-70 factor, ECF subfamily
VGLDAARTNDGNMTTISLHTMSVISFDPTSFRAEYRDDLTMTNSLSSALFPQFRPTQQAFAGASEAEATNDKAQGHCSERSLVYPPVNRIDDRTTMDRASDEAIIGMLRGGRHEAVGCLFRRYARTIYSVGKRVLHDPTEAEDLVQEVFLYVFRKSNLYDASKGSARSWLVQIAYTQAFMRRRKLKSIGFHEDSQGDNANWQPAVIECDHTVEGLFGRDGWRRILERLTEEQRETLTLHFVEGYSFGEIAEKLGQSYGNVRNHYYRGLEKLRKSLAQNSLNRR